MVSGESRAICTQLPGELQREKMTKKGARDDNQRTRSHVVTMTDSVQYYRCAICSPCTPFRPFCSIDVTPDGLTWLKLGWASVICLYAYQYLLITHACFGIKTSRVRHSLPALAAARANSCILFSQSLRKPCAQATASPRSLPLGHSCIPVSAAHSLYLIPNGFSTDVALIGH